MIALGLVPLILLALPLQSPGDPPDRIIAEGADSLSLWVFFADRGFESHDERKQALHTAQQRMSEAALMRRARAGAALADDADLPVNRDYVTTISGAGKIRHESRWLNAVSVEIARDRIDEVASLPFVESVRPLARGRPAGIGPLRAPDGRVLDAIDRSAPQPLRLDEFYGASLLQLDEIGVIEAHEAGYTGARIRLMMIDTGYRTDHDAFEGTQLLAEYDFLQGDGRTQNEPGDEPTAHDHGTITWSAAGANAPGRLIGPAYGSTFILAKTENVAGEYAYEEDNYIAALEWGDSLGADIATASLVFFRYDDGSGYEYADMDGDTAPVTRAIDRAAARGMLCLNGAGNSGPDAGTIGVPADADTMLAVGAVNAGNTITNFSSRGPTADGRLKPEVVARGAFVSSADPISTQSYGTASGTSLSTPLVAGACALVWEAHPEWSMMQVRESLMMTADRAGNPDNIYGYGRINTWRAIQYEPRVAPVPFGLLSPASSDTVDDLLPTFVWTESTDPGGGEIHYEVWISDDPAFRDPITYTGITDTVFTLPRPLDRATVFHWIVIAEEQGGYRRVSRETRTFYTPVSQEPIDPPPPNSVWRIEATPNPWQVGSSLRLHAPPGSIGDEVRLTVLDAAGRRLKRESRTVATEGWSDWPWDPGQIGGEGLPSGVYMVMLEGGGRVAKTRVVIAR